MPFSSRIYPILITCPRGASALLKDEVQGLGFALVSEIGTGVFTEGTLADAMKLNLHVRTGHRVLCRVGSFTAGNPREFYSGVSSIPWEYYLERDGYFSVTSTVSTPSIRDSQYANLKCKDAIADRFNRKYGRRPDSGPGRERTVVHLHWDESTCHIYLDTSGEPLSRRGYRKIPLHAPMQETLAAAVILATGWRGSSHFVNPMCGSGTLAIEAALITLDRAPGSFRDNFGFMHIVGYDGRLWRTMKNKANRDAKRSCDIRIIATDISEEAIEAAKRNAARAGVEDVLEFGVCDFSRTTVPEGGGVVMLNPGYGERLGDVDSLRSTYHGIGDFFKQRCQGFDGYIFTGNLALAKEVGLRTSRRIPFFNGPIECRLLEYALYRGSRKDRSGVRGENADP